MPTIIIKPSDKFKQNFDKIANKVAREVHRLMKEKQMKSIEKASEEIKDIFEHIWETVFANRSQLLGDRQIAEHFFVIGYEAAILERATFDEQNGLIIKDIGEL